MKNELLQLINTDECFILIISIFLPKDNNLINHDTLYRLKDNTSIIIKDAKRGSFVAVRDKYDYLKEPYKQFDDKAVNEEVPTYPNFLINMITKLYTNHLFGEIKK